MTTLVIHGWAWLRPAIAPLSGAWGLAALLVLGVALLDPPSTPGILLDAARSLTLTLPVIAAAVTFLAWIRAAGAEAVIGRAFQGRERRTIVAATLVGALAPFCSCQVVPLVAALIAVGTPLSAVMAFWLASPLVDPPTVMITAAALGWPFALGKALSAIGLGLAGGFALQAILRTGALADPLRPRPRSGCCGSRRRAGSPTWRFWRDPDGVSVFRSEAISNFGFLLKWLTLAYVIEALLVRYLPAQLVAGVAGGDGILPIVLGALVGMPAYLNGYVAAPMLAGLMAQGMSSGAAMAFLVAGAVSCIPAMAAVWALVRPPVFALYLGFGLIGAVAAGFVFAALV
jgi:uncharacterized membrane protein YraQ (UPF0718 family)